MGWLVALVLTAIWLTGREAHQKTPVDKVASSATHCASPCNESHGPLSYLPLTPTRLRDRSEEVYSTGVFTLVSILQGSTLAILAATAGSYFIDSEASPTRVEQTLVGLRSLCVLVVMAVVIYEYTWFGAVIRRPPKAVDAFIPVVLGAAEIGMASTIASPEVWWIFTGSFLFFSGVALTHSRFHLLELDYRPTRNVSGAEQVKDILDGGYRFLIVFTTVTALLLPASFFVLASFGDALIEIIPIVTLIGIGLLAVQKSEVMLKRLYAEFEVRR
jgi:hypothetical protein